MNNIQLVLTAIDNAWRKVENSNTSFKYQVAMREFKLIMSNLHETISKK